MKSFRILEPADRELYIDHIMANYKNSRNIDITLLEKINYGLDNDPGIIIFALFDETGSIYSSIMTRKRKTSAEYFIVNYRTSGTKFFRKKEFLILFDQVFQYYESIGYYRWLLIRQIDLFGKHFTGTGDEAPFNRYETAIEYAPRVETNLEFYYHAELFSGIPESTSIEDFILMGGYCKQQYRTQFTNLNFI